MFLFGDKPVILFCIRVWFVSPPLPHPVPFPFPLCAFLSSFLFLRSSLVSLYLVLPVPTLIFFLLPRFPLSVLGFSFPSIVSIPHYRLTRAYLHLLTTTIGTFYSFAFAGFFLYRSRLALYELPRLPRVYPTPTLPYFFRAERTSQHLPICFVWRCYLRARPSWAQWK